MLYKLQKHQAFGDQLYNDMRFVHLVDLVYKHDLID